MYIVTEIQTNLDGTVGILNSTYSNRNEAESKYHTILQFAAISTLPVHAAMIFTEEGFLVMSQCYKHEVATEESEDIEPNENNLEMN